MKSNFLALDCTGETFAAGLLVDGQFLSTVNGLNPRRALRELPAHVAYLLKNAQLTYREIGAVGVTQGPGSFTGVRLGVTLVKTIAQQANCKVAAFDTLDVLARGLADRFTLMPGSIAVALDARRQELYCALPGFGTSSKAEPTAVRGPEEFAEMVAASADLRACVGQGFAAYPELVPPGFRGPVLSSRVDSAPCMATLCQMTSEAAAVGELLTWLELAPAYHREADIQVSGGSK